MYERVLEVKCPTCGAPAGSRCVSMGNVHKGKHLDESHSHATRFRLSQNEQLEMKL
jgi:hypothetical protein